MGVWMQLAINYSPEAAALLEAGEVSFDLYKCPDWPDLVMEAQHGRPVYVHFPLGTARGKMAQIDWALIERFLTTTQTRYVNLHVAPDYRLFEGLTLHTQDTTWTERLFEAVMADIDIVKARYGAEQVILENVPYDPSFAIPVLTITPEFFNRVVDESGCGVLLDTAHARIAALYFGVDEIDYVNALRVDRLREIHVTGTLYDEEKAVWCDHFAMKSQDWRLAEHVMGQVADGIWPQPEIVALEYGGIAPLFDWRSESHVIAADLPRLHNLLKFARAHGQAARIGS